MIRRFFINRYKSACQHDHYLTIKRRIMYIIRLQDTFRDSHSYFDFIKKIRIIKTDE